MILLDNVTFSYNPEGPPIFLGITLSIPSGAWVGITGPDGSGKTTLGKLVKGLLKPQSGSVVLDATDQSGSLFVGYLGGDPYDALVGISVEEDIAFGLENLNLAPPEMRARMDRAVAWTGLSGLESRLVHTLSGGEQQKLALAGVLAMDARILVIDEAMNMLDRPARQVVRSLIKDLQSDLGVTIIEMTQDLGDLLSSDRVIYLDRGFVAFDGLPWQFLSTPEAGRHAGRMGGIAGLRQALVKAGLVPADCSQCALLEALLNYLKE